MGLTSEDPSCTGRGTRPPGERHFKPGGGDEDKADFVINPTAHKMDGQSHGQIIHLQLKLDNWWPRMEVCKVR